MKQIDAFASALNGSTYPFEPKQEIQRAAKECGIVIVFGASDDLMEFRGAIWAELSAYKGRVAYLTGSGLVVNECGNDECPHYVRAKAKADAIRAVWSEKEDDPCWTYETDIQHATFEVTEDGEVYCRGIVFDLADAGVL